MKCPECQQDMTQSRVGWLCLNCGHHEGPDASTTPVTPEEASKPVVETTTASTPAPPPVSEAPAEIVNHKDTETPAQPPADSPASLSEPRQRLARAEEAKPDQAALKDTPEVPVIATTPAESPTTETQPEAPTVVAQVTPNEPAKPDATVSEPVSVHVDEVHAPRTQPAPFPVEVPPSEGSSAPVSDNSKPEIVKEQRQPLIAATHPQKTESQAWIMAFGGFLAVASLGSAFYWFALAPNGPQRQTAVDTTFNTPTVLDAQSTPEPTPVATPDVVANDTQRQADLVKFVAAYAATASAGYYRVAPPVVTVDATDPTTGVAYVIVATSPTEVGQVQYVAGGSCTGVAITPGKLRTRQVALYTKLEGSDTLYCLDVK